MKTRAAQPILLDVEDLSVRIPTPRGQVHAVAGVSLKLERGATLGVVGESGSGKTVLVRAIMGLVSRRMASITGEVHFDGRELTAMDERELRRLWGRDIGMVFQDPMTSLNPVRRIGPQVTTSLEAHYAMSRRERRERAVSLLRSMRIPEPERRARQYPHQLSGGMRQRVGIAMALAGGPRLLLADEPTTALDVTVQAQVLDLLAEQQQERAMTLVLVSHDLGVVAGRTERVAVMYAGRIVETGPTADVFARPRMPYTAALLNARPSLRSVPGTRLEAIGGRPPPLLDPAPGCTFRTRCSRAQPICELQRPPTAAVAGSAHEFACWNPLPEPVKGGVGGR